MSSIVQQQVGKHAYLYETVSYRDSEQRSKNKRTTIGKFDPVTAQTVHCKRSTEQVFGSNVKDEIREAEQ